MKLTQKLFALVAFAFITLSFTTLGGTKKDINTKTSTLTWKGYKITGAHEGTIQIKSGHLDFSKDVLTGGEFVVDMTSINVTDLDGGYKDKLEGHLKSDDFFGVASHPTANLVFTKVAAESTNNYSVTADLTIKGKTHPITFKIAVNGNKATTALKIDRTKFDIKYGSASFFDGLKDKAIKDEFDINASLEF